VRVLVDSSVWVDFLRDNSSPAVDSLVALIEDGQDICICGFILTEVLQGIREEKQYLATKTQFENLIYLDSDRSTFELAASIFRDLRRQGITIRNSIDCLIAATAIQNSVALLECDRDYTFIAQHYPVDLIAR
jgi:predicted nucleic acid-binding protein